MDSRLSVDRIEFMLYPSGRECGYIYQQIRRLETFGRAYSWRSTYTTSAMVFVSPSPRLNLFFSLGFAHDRNYVKVGWVLYGMTAAFKRCIDSLLNEIVPGGTEAVLNAHVGYIEIAADFTGISMEDIEAFDTRLQDGYVWPRIRRPKQTIYCGNRRGIRRVCIYDRRMRLRARGIYFPEPELRVETRLRLYDRELVLTDIPSRRNPFASVYLVDFERVIGHLGGKRDTRFLQDAEKHGLNNALHWGANWDRKRRIDVIRRHALCEWWDHDLVWQGAENALAGVAL